MRISALNGTKYNSVIKTQLLKPKNSIELSRENNIQKASGNYGQAQININKQYNPSFGMDPVTLAAIIGYALFYAGVVGAGVYQTNLDEKKRAEEQAKIEKETNDSITGISQRFRVPFEEAKKYHYSFLRLADIPMTNDGNEIGLNAVQGYGVEKYKLAVDLIAPFVAQSKGEYLSYSKQLPNGVILYGPSGGGKTYMADKVCEHLRYLGMKVSDVELSETNHSQNVRTIQKAFADAQENYEKTGKLTLINFTQDVDNFFMDRRNHPECLKEVRALLKCGDKCAQKGAIWIGTANNPQLMDSAVLRPGRADLKIAVGDMEDFAVSDMIKYTLYKYGEQSSAESFDYQKIIDTMKEDMLIYTPAELELFVSRAINHKIIPDQPVSADMIIAEMKTYNKSDFPTLTDEMKRRFKEDREYMEKLDIPKSKPRKKIEN